MKLFMTKEEKLAKMEALNAKYEALSKEYRETVKKAQEIEATKGEKFSWSYFQRAEQLLIEMSKIISFMHFRNLHPSSHRNWGSRRNYSPLERRT